jgi:SAM-dependent methyltransferase
VRSLAEFDFQWKNLPSKLIEYSDERISELLDMTQLPPKFFKGKHCLDAGCGNGRYTYALLRLGAKVDSFDISPEAIKQCREVNHDAFVFDLMNLSPNPKYDFIFCYGVIHHLPDAQEAFRKLCSQLKEGGILFLMVYNADTQAQYEVGRAAWQFLSHEERMIFCEELSKKLGGDFHSWYDALHPRYNWSFYPYEIQAWFRLESFEQVKLTKIYNINIRGVLRKKHSYRYRLRRFLGKIKRTCMETTRTS